LADLRTLLAGGQTKDFKQIVVQTGESGSLSQFLGLRPDAVVEKPAADLQAALEPAEVGVVRIEDLSPTVSALAVEGVTLFGYQRISDPSRWPLRVPDATANFDYSTLWTLAAGGDVNLDRAIYREAILNKQGVDYPWTGGTSQITGTVCCGSGNNLITRAVSTGSPGAFGAVFKGSDLSLVNLEGPAPDHYSYHPDGFTFSFDPALLAGLAKTGISAVGLANNHIRNAGDQGVLETCRNLDAVGLAHAGAGANLTAASAPVWLAAGGQRIAFLAYDAIQSYNWASDNGAGAAPLNIDQVAKDIQAARAAGADLVIVMPHWGTEYTTAISSTQRSEAAAMVAAGADLILGSHSHWVGGINLVTTDRGTAFEAYSLGDLIFDLNYDTRTQEGVIVNLTFSGTRLLQVKLLPTLLLNYSQGSLLTGSGAAQVLNDIRQAPH
jgi:poly-gamma-glutamate synthesis protein (capsule biosynthesis protein)